MESLVRPSRWWGALLGLLLVCMACTHRPPTLWQGGASSQIQAETAYKVIYRAYRTGQLDQDAMDAADAAYEAWGLAQGHFLDAAKALHWRLHSLTCLAASVDRP